MSFVRRHLSNIVLAVIAIGLVVTLIVTQGSVTTNEKTARERNVLKAFREPEVSRLELLRGKETVVLKRSQPKDSGVDHWDFEQPFQERADDGEVDDYVSTLQFAEFSRRIKPEEVDRAAFGLDAPRLTIRLQMGEIDYELLLGKNAVSPADSAYLEVRGKGAPDPGVVIIGKGLIAQLDQDAAHFRTRDLVPYLSVALKTLELQGAGGERRLVRPTGEHAWDGWRFDGMQGNLRVDKANLDHVLSQFADLNADSFLEVKQAEAALKDAESVRIRMVPKKDGSAIATLEVGGVCPNGKGVVALRRDPDPLAGCVPQSLMEGLETPAKDLVDRHAFAVRADEVESFVVEHGKQKLEILRKDNGFVMRSPQSGDIDGALGNERLKQITDALGEIVPEPDLEKLGLKPPAGKVVLRVVGKDATGLVEHRISLSKPDADGAVYALREADGGVLKLGAEVARLFKADSTLVRKREVLNLDRQQLKSVHIEAESAFGHISQTLNRAEDGTYELVKPAKLGHDAGLTSDLVDGLLTLNAERWVADEDDGSFGLDKPSAKLKLETYPHGDKKAFSFELVVGAETAGGAYASVGGDPAVFILPRSTQEAIATWLIDRSLLMLEPNELVRVTLKRGGQTWVLKKDGERFVLESGELSAEKIAQIIELLSVARAEAALHLGAPRPQEGFREPSLIVDAERLPARGDRSTPIHLEFGAGDAWRGTSVFYARRKGFDCTFAIARGRVQPILDSL
ncbi:MAG: DUF4340 domain-containing protein [Polyangiaceae bacterium]|nr:DUF4340 domain-containing protein [Polyangiaceae bacterium]